MTSRCRCLIVPAFLLLSWALSFVLGGCRSDGRHAAAEFRPADREATPEARRLHARLLRLLDCGTMAGHQDALAYGIGWHDREERCDFRETAGDYPAIFGWEVGELELGGELSLDSVRFDRIRSYMQRTHRMGGINTLSWHLHNPSTLGTSWDPSTAAATAELLTAGSEARERLIGWIDLLADFLLSIRDDDGRPVPILFRPWHEMSGDWFWWGSQYCTPEQYRELWRLTVRRLQECGVHHLLYSYSTSDFESEEEFLRYWPGDGWVDVIGFDAYQFDEEPFARTLSRQIGLLERIAEKHGKIAALTEAGYERIPDSTWFTRVLYPQLHGHRLSYVLFWRNACNRPEHFYAPYPGHSAAADLERFVSQPDILTLEEIRPVGQQTSAR